MNYHPGWYGPPQYPPYTAPQSGVVYVPIEMGKGGKTPKERDLAKQIRKVFEVQELLKNGGDKKKDEPKKDDKPKRPMIPVAEGLFLAVLLSPFLGLPTLYMYKALFNMWGAAIGVK